MVDFKMEVPFFDASAPYLAQQEQLDDAIKKVLTDGTFINGKEVELFSTNLAIYLDIAHVIPCANGTDALTLALMALNLEKGDEVIVPVYNFIAAAEAVALLGLVPVFIDANESDFNIDCSLIENSITSKTKAIIVVHLFGAPAQMDTILKIAEKYRLLVIEDVAQSLGSAYQGRKLGTFGHIACTSFFPTKNLACFGDGGAIFTNDPKLAKTLRMMANHGQFKKYEHEIIGVNSRLDTLQAAVLNVKLEQLDNAIERRRSIGKYYGEQLTQLEGINLPAEQSGTLHSYNQYCILLKSEILRDRMKAYLHDLGISTMIYYPKSSHQQKAFARYGYMEGDFPVSEHLCSRNLALPIFPTLTVAQQLYIVQNIKSFFENAS